jgi:predicted DNA-binding WGR domain protein
MGVIFRKTSRLVLEDTNTGKKKFWDAEVNGNSVTIHFGNIGTPGIRGTREFTTYEAAEHFLARRVRKKLEEGYKPELSK